MPVLLPFLNHRQEEADVARPRLLQAVHYLIADDAVLHHDVPGLVGHVCSTMSSSGSSVFCVAFFIATTSRTHCRKNDQRRHMHWIHSLLISAPIYPISPRSLSSSHPQVPRRAQLPYVLRHHSLLVHVDDARAVCELLRAELFRQEAALGLVVGRRGDAGCQGGQDQLKQRGPICRRIAFVTSAGTVGARRPLFFFESIDFFFACFAATVWQRAPLLPPCCGVSHFVVTCV